ncbi:MAG: glycerate kinase [Bacteroidota bacterium]
MKVLIAPDKFKGTLTAAEVAEAMATGVRQVQPDYEVELLPLADGGEGTAAILTQADEGSWTGARASDAMFRQVSCGYGVGFHGDMAFIDVAEASGWYRLTERERNPLRTTTLGTGELMAVAMRNRCKTLVIGLGGSATIDLGMGIMHGLGVRFYDKEKNLLSPMGGNLEKVHRIDHSTAHPRLPVTKMILLTDVDNPLLGENGALMFARQKGLREADRSRMLAGMAHFANLLEREFGVQTDLPGTGAAGGAALGCIALARTKVQPGARYVMKTQEFRAAAKSADLILTGEGHLDAQTARGKVVAEVATQAAALGIPALAVAGTVTLAPQEIENLGLIRATPLYPEAPPVRTSAREHRAAIVQAVAALLKNR